MFTVFTKAELIFKQISKFAVFLLFFILMGCQSNRLTPEMMEKQLAGFQLPEKPKKNKALVYFIYSKSMPSVPKEISLSYGVNDQERYEREVNQFMIGLNIFTFDLFKDPPITDRKIIGSFRPGEYQTLEFAPGYYNFCYDVVIAYGIECKPYTCFLKLEEGQVYYLLLEWSAFYNRYSRQLEQNLYLRLDKDDLSGKYKLSKNFKKANQDKNLQN